MATSVKPTDLRPSARAAARSGSPCTRRTCLAMPTSGLSLFSNSGWSAWAHSHRAVHVNGQVGKLAGVHQLVQEIDNGLRTTDAEGRDQQRAAALGRAADDLGQMAGRFLNRFMRVAAIGAFADQEIASRNR